MPTTTLETPLGPIHIKSNGHRRPLVSFMELPRDLWDSQFDYVRDIGECEGHESLNGAHMGETVYCDGTCNAQPSEWHDLRFFEYRGSWYDLFDGFESVASNPYGTWAPIWVRDAGFNAWQTESAFSAVLVRYFEGEGDSTRLLDDGDSVVIGYAHW